MKRIMKDRVQCFGISTIHNVTYDDGTKKTFIGNSRIPAQLKRFLRSATIAEDAYLESGESVTIYIEGGC